jgi:hypothetical protein
MQLTLYIGEIKTCMQDSFLIEDWYHFRDFGAPVGTGRELVRSLKTAARASLPTALEFTDPSLWTMVLRSPP